MFSFLFRKQHQVEQLLFEYCDNLREAQDNYRQAMELFCEKGTCEDFEFLLQQTHKMESKADDLRYAIESMMYERALIPESRGDILGLLEAIDEWPGMFDRVLLNIDTRQVAAPDDMLEDIRELTRLTVEAGDALLAQVRALFTPGTDMRQLMELIDRNESHCDHIEHRVKKRVFASDIGFAEQYKLDSLLSLMGEIPDVICQVSRRLYIVSVKRRV